MRHRTFVKTFEDWWPEYIKELREHGFIDGEEELLDEDNMEKYYAEFAWDASRKQIEEGLYEFIAHGDERHKRWLRRAIKAFFNNEPRPEEEPK